jgi:hypothetical protein
VTIGEALNCGHQRSRGLTLPNNGISASLPTCGFCLTVLIHAEENDFRGWCDPPYFARGFNSAHYRHTYVENDQVRHQLLNFFHGFPAILGFAANFAIWVPRKKCADTGANVGVVICNQNSSHISRSAPPVGNTLSLRAERRDVTGGT